MDWTGFIVVGSLPLNDKTITSIYNKNKDDCLLSLTILKSYFRSDRLSKAQSTFSDNMYWSTFGFSLFRIFCWRNEIFIYLFIVKKFTSEFYSTKVINKTICLSIKFVLRFFLGEKKVYPDLILHHWTKVQTFLMQQKNFEPSIEKHPNKHII